VSGNDLAVPCPGNGSDFWEFENASSETYGETLGQGTF